MARTRAKPKLEPQEADVKAAYDRITQVQQKEVVTVAGFIVDLKGVSTSNVIDEGEYRVTLSKATPRKAASGNMTVNVELTINDPEHADLNGRKLFTNYTLIPSSFFALKRDLIVLGADPEDLEGQFDIIEMFASLYGRPVKAVVTVQPRSDDPDTMQNRIKLQEWDD